MRHLNAKGPGSCLYLSLEQARAIYDRVSEVTGISLDHLLGEGREGLIGRWVVMHEMRRHHASAEMIGKRMLLDHGTVQYGLRRLKERKDTAPISAWLAALEERAG